MKCLNRYISLLNAEPEAVALAVQTPNSLNRYISLLNAEP